MGCIFWQASHQTCEKCFIVSMITHSGYTAPARTQAIDQTQLGGGIDQSTSNAPTAIMESTALATTSAGQGMTFTEGEGGGGPG